MILSNNHVLANENRAKNGDAIIQPGAYDGGADPDDKVATLTPFIRLKNTGPNLVDAAVATLESGITYSTKTLSGLEGSLTGVGPSFLDEGTPVSKVGRTTGATKGKVTAFELDNVFVSYDVGSLIVAADRKGVALLFARGDLGGPNGKASATPTRSPRCISP